MNSGVISGRLLSRILDHYKVLCSSPGLNLKTYMIYGYYKIQLNMEGTLKIIEERLLQRTRVHQFYSIPIWCTPESPVLEKYRD